jgi:hypothetical protein
LPPSARVPAASHTLFRPWRETRGTHADLTMQGFPTDIRSRPPSHPSPDTVPRQEWAQNLVPSNPSRLWSAQDSAKFNTRKGFVCICQQTGAFLQRNARG